MADDDDGDAARSLSKETLDLCEVEAVLSDVLDKIAPLTQAEKAKAYLRCTFRHADGMRCTNQGQPPKPRLCIKHGGKVTCYYPECTTRVEGSGRYCPVHATECTVDGCQNPKVRSDGLCWKHAKEANDAPAYELVRRLKRDRALRNQWLFPILEEQGGRCAQSLKTCAVVANGEATSVCPWGERPVPPDAADVEHIVPKCEGGSDERPNLQVLCKCCHGLKSAAEARARGQVEELRTTLTQTKKRERKRERERQEKRLEELNNALRAARPPFFWMVNCAPSRADGAHAATE